MPDRHPLDLDATDQAALVRRGEVTPVEMVQAALERIDERNPALNAVIRRRDERALAEAAAVDPAAPFAGVPLLVKDLMIELGGEPFYEGMAYLRDLDYTPEFDQTLARRFKGAGFVIVGRTNTSELGGVPTTEPLAFGPTHNPWLPGHTPGGSSGGSAAAVASGMTAVAHANDAGGSIRTPAARCGVVGLKPSRGRVPLGPRYGDLFGGLVAELAVTRTVRDARAVLDAVAGTEPGDPYGVSDQRRLRSVRSGELRIGVWSGIPGGVGQLSREAKAAVAATADALTELGHDVVEAHPAALDTKRAQGVLGRIFMAGTDWAIRRWERLTGVPARPAQLEPITRMYVEEGRKLSAVDLLDLIEAGQLVTRDVGAWFAEGFDLLVMATVAERPNPLGELQAETDDEVGEVMRRIRPSLSLTSWVNLTGLPAISVPLYWTEDGIPMGTQLIGPAGAEPDLLAVASQLEQAVPWAHRYPAPAP